MTLALKLADARYEGFDEGFAEGREAGLQQGLERGAYENKLETARNPCPKDSLLRWWPTAPTFRWSWYKV